MPGLLPNGPQYDDRQIIGERFYRLPDYHLSRHCRGTSISLIFKDIELLNSDLDSDESVREADRNINLETEVFREGGGGNNDVGARVNSFFQEINRNRDANVMVCNGVHAVDINFIRDEMFRQICRRFVDMFSMYDRYGVSVTFTGDDSEYVSRIRNGECVGSEEWFTYFKNRRFWHAHFDDKSGLFSGKIFVEHKEESIMISVFISRDWLGGFVHDENYGVGACGCPKCNYYREKLRNLSRSNEFMVRQSEEIGEISPMLRDKERANLMSCLWTDETFYNSTMGRSCVDGGSENLFFKSSPLSFIAWSDGDFEHKMSSAHSLDDFLSGVKRDTCVAINHYRRNYSNANNIVYRELMGESDCEDGGDACVRSRFAQLYIFHVIETGIIPPEYLLNRLALETYFDDGEAGNVVDIMRKTLCREALTLSSDDNDQNSSSCRRYLEGVEEIYKQSKVLRDVFDQELNMSSQLNGGEVDLSLFKQYCDLEDGLVANYEKISTLISAIANQSVHNSERRCFDRIVRNLYELAFSSDIIRAHENGTGSDKVAYVGSYVYNKKAMYFWDKQHIKYKLNNDGERYSNSYGTSALIVDFRLNRFYRGALLKNLVNVSYLRHLVFLNYAAFDFIAKKFRDLSRKIHASDGPVSTTGILSPNSAQGQLIESARAPGVRNSVPSHSGDVSFSGDLDTNLMRLDFINGNLKDQYELTVRYDRYIRGGIVFRSRVARQIHDSLISRLKDFDEEAIESLTTLKYQLERNTLPVVRAINIVSERYEIVRKRIVMKLEMVQTGIAILQGRISAENARLQTGLQKFIEAVTIIPIMYYAAHVSEFLFEFVNALLGVDLHYHWLVKALGALGAATFYLTKSDVIKNYIKSKFE